MSLKSTVQKSGLHHTGLKNNRNQGAQYLHFFCPPPLLLCSYKFIIPVTLGRLTRHKDAVSNYNIFGINKVLSKYEYE